MALTQVGMVLTQAGMLLHMGRHGAPHGQAWCSYGQAGQEVSSVTGGRVMGRG